MRADLHPYIRIVVNHSQKCNMHCTWCHEEGMQLVRNDRVLSPATIKKFSKLLHATGARKFKLVGGEPTLRNDLDEIIREIRSIDPFIDISMVTNGTRLRVKAQEYAAAGINRINISLFSLDEGFFTKNVGPASLMSKVISGIDHCKELGLCGKINHVYHDKADLLRILAYARSREIRVNILNKIPSLSSSEGMPISELLDVLYNLPVAEVTDEYDPYSLPVKVITLKDGTEIEVKHQEIGAQERFLSCRDCRVRNLCREGIFALRITPTGQIQPCIVRSDNSLALTSGTTVEVVKSYLDAL